MPLSDIRAGRRFSGLRVCCFSTAHRISFPLERAHKNPSDRERIANLQDAGLWISTAHFGAFGWRMNELEGDANMACSACDWLKANRFRSERLDWLKCSQMPFSAFSAF